LSSQETLQIRFQSLVELQWLEEQGFKKEMEVQEGGLSTIWTQSLSNHLKSAQAEE
jgi:hypothetical protein